MRVGFARRTQTLIPNPHSNSECRRPPHGGDCSSSNSSVTATRWQRWRRQQRCSGISAAVIATTAGWWWRHGDSDSTCDDSDRDVTVTAAPAMGATTGPTFPSWRVYYWSHVSNVVGLVFRTKAYNVPWGQNRLGVHLGIFIIVHVFLNTLLLYYYRLFSTRIVLWCVGRLLHRRRRSDVMYVRESVREGARTREMYKGEVEAEYRQAW